MYFTMMQLLMISVFALTIHAQKPPKYPLVITEIMYNTKDAGKEWQWIELYNSGETDISFYGWVFDNNDANAFSGSNIQANAVIQAHQAAVLYDAGTISVGQFYETWGDGIPLIPVTEWVNHTVLKNDTAKISLWDSFFDYVDDNQHHENTVLTLVVGAIAAAPPYFSSIYLKDFDKPLDNTSWSVSSVGAPQLNGMAYLSQNASDGSGPYVGSPGTRTYIQLSPTNAVISEGGSVSIVIQRSGIASNLPYETKVAYQLVIGPPIPSPYVESSDFPPGSGIFSGLITFLPGETFKSIGFPTVQDSIEEPDKFFQVKLVDSPGFEIVDGFGAINCTLVDDDTSHSDAPSRTPSYPPTIAPTDSPTQYPTATPTSSPTHKPTAASTLTPSQAPQYFNPNYTPNLQPPPVGGGSTTDLNRTDPIAAAASSFESAASWRDVLQAGIVLSVVCLWGFL